MRRFLAWLRKPLKSDPLDAAWDREDRWRALARKAITKLAVHPSTNRADMEPFFVEFRQLSKEMRGEP